MIAVGLWAAQMGGRAVWTVPTSFVALMALAARSEWPAFICPWSRPASSPSRPSCSAFPHHFAVRLPLWASASVVGFFALFHGFAHGAEMPGNRHHPPLRLRLYPRHRRPFMPSVSVLASR